MTFNWKFPAWAATVMETSFPITSAETIVTASGMTGLTLPGMILLPGCSACNSISDKPANGPLFIHLKSLEIFIRITARFFNSPES